MARVEFFQTGPVTDTDDGNPLHFVIEHRHHTGLVVEVERAGSLIKEYPGGLVQQQTGKRQQLLLTL